MTNNHTVPNGRGGGTSTLPGDWGEVFNNGNGGNNISQPLHDVADQFGTTFDVSKPAAQGGLNWGNVLTRTLYLWGPDGTTVDDSTTAQIYCNPCKRSQQPDYTGWGFIHVSGSAGNYSTDNPQGTGNEIDRVRFTGLYNVRIYANLQGNYGPVMPPECSSWTWSPPNSIAYGLIIDAVVPPSGGDCQWTVGGGVYSRSIDPNDP